MSSKVNSAAVVGVEAFEVEIGVHAGWGNTDKIAVAGLPDTAVKESKDRVTSAICNGGLRWSYGQRITINLAPADVRKEGPSFDLPIAVAMQAGPSLKSRGCAKRLLSAHVISLRLEAGGARLRLALVR